MKRLLTLIVVFCILVPCIVSAKDRRLHGQVLMDDDRKPAQFVEVIIQEIGNPVISDTQGHFSSFLSDEPAYQPGNPITFLVKLEGYVMQSPVDGVFVIPAPTVTKVWPLLMQKKGEPALLTPARFEKSTKDAIRGSREPPKSKEGEKKPIHLTDALKKEADRLGIPREQYLNEYKKWADQQTQEKDPKKRGYAAAEKNDFGRAGDLFSESAERKAQRLSGTGKRSSMEPKKYAMLVHSMPGPGENHQRIRRWTISNGATFAAETPGDDAAGNEAVQQRILRNEIAEDFRLAGDAYYDNYSFEKSLAAYKRAREYAKKDESPFVWAALEGDIGLAEQAIGIRTEGEAIHEHLAAAVAAYRNSLTVYSRARLPQDWAATQNNLGIALKDQGIRTGGEEGQRLLAEAVTAYRDALKIRTREQLPQQWAATQNNLGNALKDQGIRTGGEEGQRLLAEAVEAYRKALEVRTQQGDPVGWAQTKKNLAEALVLLTP